MFFLYIQYYMHFYEIWCFLNSWYIWNRQQCGNISSMCVKRYLFGRYPVWKLVVRSVDIPARGIWMVCYQVWWSEIGCCRLVSGTGVVLRRDGQVGDVVLGTVVRRGEGRWVLSDRSKSWRADGDSSVDHYLKYVRRVRRFLLLDSGVEMVCKNNYNYYFIYRVWNEISWCRMKFTLRW